MYRYATIAAVDTVLVLAHTITGTGNGTCLHMNVPGIILHNKLACGQSLGLMKDECDLEFNWFVLLSYVHSAEKYSSIVVSIQALIPSSI